MRDTASGVKTVLFYPKDISRNELTQRMREVSFALGVRCQFCHSGGNGVSLEGVSFPSDDKPAKQTARASCISPLTAISMWFCATARGSC